MFERRLAGEKLKDIAKTYNIAPNTVWIIVNKLKVQKNA
jgi:Mor family transcriptional regulator